ncbi:MAG TPA: sialidase family protein [Candidatus Eisenbacteria bacterium]|nr:sialidase family protein [Candidatus Eisenbacteria bacterium]
MRKWLTTAIGMVLVASAAWVLAQRDESQPVRTATPEGTEPSRTVTWSPPIEVETGEAIVGPWRANASSWRYVDDPTVAMVRDGHVGVAWVDQSQKDIFFEVYEPGGSPVRQPVNVSKSPHIFSWLPRVAMTSDPPRHVYVLWQEIVFSGGSHGGEIFFARSTDGGRTFSRPINLSNTPAGDGKGRLSRTYWHNGSLDLAVAPDGTLHAAWTAYEGLLWFSRSSDGGRSFSAPHAVWGRRGEGPARGPSIGVGDSGHVVLAWSVGDDPEADIRLASSRDGGRSFGEPRVLFPSRGHADAPKVALDRGGIVHLVFAESSDGPGGRDHIRYARSSAGGRTFEAARRISDPRSESASYPALSLDERGNPYVTWELFPDRGGRSRGLGFTLSRDGGKSFSAPTVIPGTDHPGLGFNGSRQGLLMRKLAVGGNGSIAVVNSTFSEGRRSRILLFRGSRAAK